jgi:hypothetical protein
VRALEHGRKALVGEADAHDVEEPVLQVERSSIDGVVTPRLEQVQVAARVAVAVQEQSPRLGIEVRVRHRQGGTEVQPVADQDRITLTELADVLAGGEHEATAFDSLERGIPDALALENPFIDRQRTEFGMASALVRILALEEAEQTRHQRRVGDSGCAHP